MNKPTYSKPALTLTDQLDQLKDRGLTIENETKARHLLQMVSYYRLSGYWYPLLQDKQNHVFKEDATFQQAFTLYCFDRELRLLVLRQLEKIEVGFRSNVTNVLSIQYNPFWFQNSSLFKNTNMHQDSLSNIQKQIQRSDEQFIKAFQRKYANPYPPSWMTVEIIPFSTLSILYKNLVPGQAKRTIAEKFGLPDTILISWMHSMVILRNICAHHSRLWNRVMGIKPKKPRNTTHTWLTDNSIPNDRTCYTLSIVIYFLNTVNPGHTFINKFEELLDKYPDIDTRAMGFPQDWKQEPLWQN